MNYLFDLDNTLINEETYLLVTYRRIAELNNLNVKDLFDLYHKEGKDYIFQKMKTCFCIEQNIDQLKEIQRTIQLKGKMTIPNRILDYLTDKISFQNKIFVVTNGNILQQMNKVRQTEWHGLDQFITFVYANMIYPKPDARLYLYLKKKYNLLNAQTIMIGDSEIDKQFAKNSKIKFISTQNI